MSIEPMPIPCRWASTATGPRCQCRSSGSSFDHAPSHFMVRPAPRTEGEQRWQEAELPSYPRLAPSWRHHAAHAQDRTLGTARGQHVAVPTGHLRRGHRAEEAQQPPVSYRGILSKSRDHEGIVLHTAYDDPDRLSHLRSAQRPDLQLLQVDGLVPDHFPLLCLAFLLASVCVSKDLGTTNTAHSGPTQSS